MGRGEGDGVGAWGISRLASMACFSASGASWLL